MSLGACQKIARIERSYSLLDRHAFMPQQPAFDPRQLTLDLARIAAQPLSAHHPMAGNQNRYRIAPTRPTDGARGSIQLPRQFAIAPVSYTHLDVYKRQP